MAGYWSSSFFCMEFNSYTISYVLCSSELNVSQPQALSLCCPESSLCFIHSNQYQLFQNSISYPQIIIRKKRLMRSWQGIHMFCISDERLQVKPTFINNKLPRKFISLMWSGFTLDLPLKYIVKRLFASQVSHIPSSSRLGHKASIKFPHTTLS